MIYKHNISAIVGPASPLGVTLSSFFSPILQWSQPTFLYGTLLHYNILVATENDPLEASVISTTRNTLLTLSTLNIDHGIYYLWVSQ